jgi:RNA polymerase sigma factor (sigma-70 family)
MPAGGTAGGSALPLGRHAAIERTGRRGQRVWVRRGVSPPCAAESVAPDQILEADRGRQHLPGRRATACGTCAAPGSTRHATTATPSIGELLARAAQRDPFAWDEIISRYNGVVWARVRSFRLQDADAVDAVQMTWLRLAENCGRVHHPDRLGGWLSTTATRESLAIVRHTKRAAPVDSLVDTLTDPATGPERTVLDAETAQAVRALVTELPPRRRALIHAIFNQETRRYTEISRDTGIPIGSLGPTRARALRQLRRMLDERGLGHPQVTTRRRHRSVRPRGNRGRATGAEAQGGSAGLAVTGGATPVNTAHATGSSHGMGRAPRTATATASAPSRDGRSGCPDKQVPDARRPPRPINADRHHYTAAGG